MSKTLYSESVQISGFEGFTYTSGLNDYIISEGDYIFPNWKLQTDSVFYTGIQLDEKGKYSNVLGKIIIMPENLAKNRFGIIRATSGGVLNIKKYEKDIFLFHPQIFLGGNVKFKETKDDLFLILGNQPLVGNRARGTEAVWRKTIGSTQFPIKTRAQLSKINKVSIEQQISLNKSYYESINFSDTTSSTYFPKSYEPYIRISVPKLLENKWDIDNEEKQELNWNAFNSLGDVSSNMPNGNIEKILEYFDYENLNEIESKNPLLYQKLVFLINKSIDIYFKNLPSQESKTNSSAIDYVRLDFYDFRISVKSSTNPSYTSTLVYNKTIPIDKDGVVSSYIPIFPDGENREYESSIVIIVDFMQKVATRRLSSLRHPYLTLEELEFFKPKLWNLYLYPIKVLISEEENNLLKVKFNSNIHSFASNYFAYTKFISNNGFGLSLLPTLTINVNETKSWTSLVYSNISFGIFELNLSVGVSSPEKMLKTKALFGKMAMLYVTNMDMLLTISSLSSLINLFAYYETVGEKLSEVSVKDLHHDIRFKYFLLETSIKGIFTEKTIDSLIAFLQEMNEIIQNLFDIYKNDAYKSINVNIGLLDSFIDWESMGINMEYLIDKFPNSFYGNSSTTSINTASLLFMPSLFKDKLSEMIEMMKENEIVKKLLNEETTPRAEWLKLFGVDLNNDNTIDEDATIESAIIEKPIIENEDEEEDFDFDFDSLDIDDIEIDLNDDDILETNIEI